MHFSVQHWKKKNGENIEVLFILLSKRKSSSTNHDLFLNRFHLLTSIFSQFWKILYHLVIFFSIRATLKEAVSQYSGSKYSPVLSSNYNIYLWTKTLKSDKSREKFLKSFSFSVSFSLLQWKVLKYFITYSIKTNKQKPNRFYCNEAD